MLFWIVLIIAIAAAVAIGVVFFKHWKEIRLLDPDTIHSEQERKKREAIIQQRLRLAAAPLERAVRAFAVKARRTYRRTEERLLQAAGMGETRSQGGEATSPAIQALLNAAAHALATGSFGEAERTYLEILRQEPRQVQAYRGLGALYMRQRSYTQAKETFRFLEKLKGCDDDCYASLAEIAGNEGNTADAEAFYKRAVAAAPEKASRHAALAAFYIANGSGVAARAAARRAVELDPGNREALELSVESAILVRDVADAEACYEQLRPLSRDRQKLQSLRDKIDALDA
jgi:tetratricopeptide (TPR) repeat protein